MRISVNGARLYVDIEGAGLVPDGPFMREKPALILLHGGPGADHSIFKPAFSALNDLCQIIYYDHLGNGRSDTGTPEDWSLARWGDDVKGLCDALGLERPIVYGASFGGFVAQSYATRHPDHARGLILAATTAKMDFEAVFAAFERLGGPDLGALARAYWTAPTAELRATYAERCVPLYAQTGLDPDILPRIENRAAVGLYFNGCDNEQGRFDFRDGLARVSCPSLVLSGRNDPIMPPEMTDALAAALPNAKHERLEAAHMIELDASEAFFRRIRSFIEEVSQ